jgi:quinoprotein glucose dehydrogenase
MIRAALLPLLLLPALLAQAQSPDASDWGHYGGDAFAQRYSSLAEINRENVQQLEVAWEFRTGELGQGFARAERLAFQATPVVAFGLLYFATPTNVVHALEPETGRLRWRHDPRIDRSRPYAEAISRGVAAWEKPGAARGEACAGRIFAGTLDARLIALDARTGEPCIDFGNAGSVDVLTGLEVRDANHFPLVMPPVTGTAQVFIAFPTGDVRAYDARTGAARWVLQTAPVNGAMTMDLDRNLLFVPAGATLLAVDAATGKPVWHRELVHQDLWGYDLTAQPALVELEPAGIPTPSIVQATKSGMLFVFDRHSGRPVVPIVEQRVPAGRPGSKPTAATQPFPITPLLVAQHAPGDADAWGLNFWDRHVCRRHFRKHRNEGIYTPPGNQGSIQWPGDMGGIGWGGVAFDAHRQRVVAAVNHLPMVAGADGTRRPLLSSWGFPCTPPPWGTLVSVDLRSNQIVWQVPLGSTEGLGPWFAPARNFGTPSAGGPIVTAGEIVLVAAAMDGYFRAFDLSTGRELWKHRLPAGGQATPMTYRAGRQHRQFVVIAAGGDAALGTARGDHVIAFALPGK